MRRFAVVVALVIGCAGSQRENAPPGDPSREVTTALADAVKEIRARRLDSAERLLAERRQLAAHDPRLLEKVDYYIATVLAYRGELGRARNLIEAHLTTAQNRGDIDSQAWMASSLVWILWASGSVDSALVVNERVVELASSNDLDSGEKRAWQLQYLWDHAFLLVEAAATAAEGDRAAAVERARQAQRDYEAAADSPLDASSLAALTAWVAWRTGDHAGAAAALARVDVERDRDARDLWVAWVVCAATGDRERAERARTRLANTVNILVPVLLHSRPAS